MRRGLALAAIASVALTGCATTRFPPRPEFSQRPKPPEGQYEIELTAGFNGRLAIEDGCLGFVGDFGEIERFTTLVWPWNARLERSATGWQVRRTDNGTVFLVGGPLVGGGGFLPDLTGDELRRYNRSLTRKLSPECAAKGAWTLNRDFRPR